MSDRSKAQRTMKVVVLGTASSGKSTFFKQMKIINREGFDQSEHENFLRIIRNNYILGLKELVTAAQEWEVEFEDEDVAEIAEFFLKVSPTRSDAIDEEIVENGKTLWGSDEIQEVWDNRDSLPNLTIINLDYIVENIDRIASDNCKLKNEDIVRIRQRTTGISTFEFPYNKYFINLVDVGGQRTERKKWSLVAENPTATVFFTSLCDFDIPLVGSEETTRFEESIQVWNEVLTDELYENATCLLFLNKSDLFRRKIEKVDLSETFPEYDGGDNYDSATEFIKTQFLNAAEDTYHLPDTIYCHITCAIDSDFMRDIFTSIMTEIFTQRLAKSGFRV
eukprot:TRINITY_DN2066_c0_g1_i1.p1 TRINITY_DN2066_c0_g1~~TRINITY_DN2066_c0_g1_i1.p1  ORF type:complete len:336 (+),score=75.89 TRINITY_DN2066_c0_g1_i1:147-1154(+)